MRALQNLHGQALEDLTRQIDLIHHDRLSGKTQQTPQDGDRRTEAGSQPVTTYLLI